MSWQPRPSRARASCSRPDARASERTGPRRVSDFAQAAGCRRREAGLAGAPPGHLEEHRSKQADIAGRRGGGRAGRRPTAGPAEPPLAVAGPIRTPAALTRRGLSDRGLATLAAASSSSAPSSGRRLGIAGGSTRGFLVEVALTTSALGDDLCFRCLPCGPCHPTTPSPQLARCLSCGPRHPTTPSPQLAPTQITPHPIASHQVAPHHAVWGKDAGTKTCKHMSTTPCGIRPGVVERTGSEICGQGHAETTGGRATRATSKTPGTRRMALEQHWN